MNPDQLIEGFTWFVVFIFSTTLHEAGHALVAWKLGDPTAYEGGQVSLNPLPHIQREPVGMVIVPIISFALNGWMMGWASAPYDPAWAHRYPKRAALMAAAGPAANLLLTVIAGLLIKFGIAGLIHGAIMPIGILFLLNLLLFVFNLLPVPPLDGSAILPMFMSDNAARRYREFLHQPMFSLIGLLLAWKVFPYIFEPISAAAFAVLR
ncbi:MAG TPA: site-2 protease family protein [Thermoanaerobaculia bacterium]|nr:site-2 protease family protein [Thermoanaerobaculia bacterium]